MQFQRKIKRQSKFNTASLRQGIDIPPKQFLQLFVVVQTKVQLFKKRHRTEIVIFGLITKLYSECSIVNKSSNHPLIKIIVCCHRLVSQSISGMRFVSCAWQITLTMSLMNQEFLRQAAIPKTSRYILFVNILFIFLITVRTYFIFI